VNSSLRETAKLQAKVAEISGGASRALIPGRAQPAEQLLRQW
jgi:hypothetical protein